MGVAERMAMVEASRLSRVVRYGGFIYISGQTVQGRRDSSLIGQITMILDRIDHLLGASGSDKWHLLSATMLVRPEEDVAQVHESWQRWIGDAVSPVLNIGPGFTLQSGVKIEISITAIACNSVP